MPGNWTEIDCFKNNMPIKMQKKKHKKKSKKRKKERKKSKTQNFLLHGNTQNIYFTFAVKFLTRRSWSLSLGRRPYTLVIKKEERVKVQLPKKFHQLNRHITAKRW